MSSIQPDDAERAHVARAGFALTRDEFGRFLRWQLGRSPVTWSNVLVVVLTLLAAVVVASLVDRDLGLILLCLGAFTGAFWAWHLATLPRRIWAKRGADIGAQRTVDFSADGVHVHSANIDTRTKWALYTRLVDLGDLYLLGTRNRLLFQVIPKRAFESPSDQNLFIELVGTYVGMGSSS